MDDLSFWQPCLLLFSFIYSQLLDFSFWKMILSLKQNHVCREPLKVNAWVQRKLWVYIFFSVNFFDQLSLCKPSLSNKVYIFLFHSLNKRSEIISKCRHRNKFQRYAAWRKERWVTQPQHCCAIDFSLFTPCTDFFTVTGLFY